MGSQTAVAGAVQEYLMHTPMENIDTGFLAYLSSLTEIAKVVPEVARSIVQELVDQRMHLKLIASENYSSLPTQLAMGNLLTDKYAEGFAYHRFYAGCENVDAIEEFACKQACELFGAEHAYVQPHSGADANLIAYWSILNARVEEPILKNMGEKNSTNLSNDQWEKLRKKIGSQRLLGLDYYSGGHLTHGYRHNVSAKMFESHAYHVSKQTGLLDYDEIENQVLHIKPLILLAGYSAYPRMINFKRMREIADKVNAVLMVDMAHFAGLVAGKVFRGDFDPIPHSQVVTTTTHKTLRGPRGGMILCTKEFSEYVDKGCPLVMGGPLPQVMAAKAIALKEANNPEFKSYARNIVKNSKALAQACVAEGMSLPTGGTDNHLFLIDVRPFGLTGRQAESVLRESGFTLNRNSLPYDSNGPWYTSGLRLGTPAVTTLGMGSDEMEETASIINLVLKNTRAEIITKGENSGKSSKAKYAIDPPILQEARDRVKILLDRFPVYPELELNLLQRHFG